MSKSRLARWFDKQVLRVLVVSVLLALPASRCLAQEEKAFTLARAGRPTAMICSGAKPSTLTNLAVEAIQRRVEALAGVRLPVSTDAEAAAGNGRVLILVGTSAENPLLKKTAAENELDLQEAQLGGEGFRVLTLTTKHGKRCILAAGADTKGAYYAGCWLARRIFAEDDLVYTRALDLREKPCLAVRGVYDGEWQSDVLKMTKQANRYDPDNLSWWKNYIDLLGSFGANHFEVWPGVLEGLAGISKDQLQQKVNWLEQISRYCRERGMEFHVVACANVVHPSYLKDSPELKGEGGKGSTVCPSKPGGTELLLRAKSEAINRIKNLIDGVVFYGYDPGGCDCEQCGGMHKDYYRTYMRLMNCYSEMVRGIDPRIKVSAVLWLFRTDERRKILENIHEWPQDLQIEAELFSLPSGRSYLKPLDFDPEAIGIMKALARRHRLILWDHESDMEPVMWLENPVPDRIGRRVELAREMGCVGAIGFILSHPVKLINSAALVQKAWNPSLTTREVLMEFSRAVFASEDERIVSAIVQLARWAELLGDLRDRMLDWAARASPDDERKWRTGLEYGRKAGQLLAEAEHSVTLGRDYYAYLKALAKIHELICARLLKQSQASGQLREWEALDETRAKEEGLKTVRDLLRATNEINSQIAQELANTPLAGVPSFVEADGFNADMRNSIYNAEMIEDQIRALEDWQRSVSLLGRKLREWKGKWWNEEWNYRVKILAAVFSAEDRLRDASLEEKDRYWHAQSDTKSPVVELAWSDDAHTGKAAALLAINEPGKNYVVLQTNPRGSDVLGIGPRQNYEVSFWYKVLSGKPTLYLDLHAGDAMADGKDVHPQLIRDGEWHRCSVVLESPEFSPRKHAALRFVASREPQRILIDDVSIETSAKETEHFLAKCPINFDRLLTATGGSGKADPASLRLVEYDEHGKTLSEVPFEFESHYGPQRERKGTGSLYWSVKRRPEKPTTQFYYLYFDLLSRGPKPRREPPKVRGKLRDSSMEARTEWWEKEADAQPPVVEFAWSHDAHSGKTAALLSVKEECKNYVLLQTNPANNQAIGIKPQRAYKVSFWCKVLSGEPKFYLDFFAGLRGGDGNNVHPSLVADGKWRRYRLTLLSPEFAPERTAALRFVAYFDPQKILIDDVEILKEPVPLVMVAEQAETRAR